MGCNNMRTQVFRGLQLPPLINPGKFARKPSISVLFLHINGEKASYSMCASFHLVTRKGRFRRPLVSKVSHSSEISPAPVLDTGSSKTSVDESKILYDKAQDVEPYLNGRGLYLVGMMGSGKTTVGKVLAEALGYSFCDCDTLIEEAAGGCSVAEIFKLHGENFFRDNETEVLHRLSLMPSVIVSTGGGAVARPINWIHMRKGFSIWLDVPLEALARRIIAVGTDSRPLLHQQGGDPYSQTMKRLSTLFEERGEAYANADVRVSLEEIAAKLGCIDVCDVTPTAIAIQVLLQIQHFFCQESGIKVVP